MSATRHQDIKEIILPDLVSHCTFPSRLNRFCEPVAARSEAWMINGAQLSDKRCRRFRGLKAGLLTAMCYPDCGEEELRVVADFMNYLFNLDDWTDEFDVQETKKMADSVMNALFHPERDAVGSIPGSMAKCFWERLARKAGPGCQQRFLETFDMFFQAVTQQSRDRSRGDILDLESYTTLRRDTSGCKPVFVLIEYAAGIDLPDEVADHPIIRDLNEATNDLVTWSNDIFSYDVEQSRGDTHNMIPILVHSYGLDVQSAVDTVGELCKASIARFTASRALLPSWNPEIDRAVEKYVLGLQDWIVGSLHWSFETERYFGKGGAAAKSTRRVALQKKRNAQCFHEADRRVNEY